MRCDTAQVCQQKGNLNHTDMHKRKSCLFRGFANLSVMEGLWTSHVRSVRGKKGAFPKQEDSEGKTPTQDKKISGGYLWNLLGEKRRKRPLDSYYLWGSYEGGFQK